MYQSMHTPHPLLDCNFLYVFMYFLSDFYFSSSKLFAQSLISLSSSLRSQSLLEIINLKLQLFLARGVVNYHREMKIPRNAFRTKIPFYCMRSVRATHLVGTRFEKKVHDDASIFCPSQRFFICVRMNNPWETLPYHQLELSILVMFVSTQVKCECRL